MKNITPSQKKKRKKRKPQPLTMSEAYLLGTIASSARKDWKAAVWLLEKKNPKRWGEPPRYSSLEELIVKLTNEELIDNQQLEELTKLSETVNSEALRILSNRPINARIAQTYQEDTGTTETVEE